MTLLLILFFLFGFSFGALFALMIFRDTLESIGELLEKDFNKIFSTLGSIKKAIFLKK